MLNRILLNTYYTSYRLPDALGGLIRSVIRWFRPGISVVGTDIERITTLAKSVIKQLPSLCKNRTALAELYEDSYRFELEPILAVGIHRLRCILSLDQIAVLVAFTYYLDRDQGKALPYNLLNAYVHMLYDVQHVIEEASKASDLNATQRKCHVVQTLVAHSNQFWPNAGGTIIIKALEL